MNVELFRIAIKEDAEEIGVLVNKAYRPISGDEGWTHESEFVSGNRISILQMKEILTAENTIIILGVMGHKIVSCVSVEKKGKNGYIGMLAVSPELQASGIGKKMLSEAEKFAVENFKSVKFVMQVLSARTELLAFYIRRGYHVSGIATEYPATAGIGVPKQAGLKVETLEKMAQLIS